MRFTLNKAFPYPVLSEYSDDYGDRAFQVAFKPFDIQDGTVTLSVKCTLSDEALKGLVEKGDAAYAIEVYCPKTFSRTIEIAGQESFSIDYAVGDFHGLMEINAFVVCRQPVFGFHSPNFDSEFGEGTTFDFRPGDVLAVQAPRSFWWDTAQTQPITTVFQLGEDANLEPGTFGTSWLEDKIRILLRPEDERRFQQARTDPDRKPSLLAAVYCPVLVETLREMATSDDPLMEDKRWYNAINYKLQEEGIQLNKDSDFWKLAQKLLRQPLNGILPPRN